MGDQIGTAVEGALYHVGAEEFARVRGLDLGPEASARLFADLCRINALYMIGRAGSGHIGSSFSAMDIVAWLYLNELKPGDTYFSSKGHDCPGLYAVLIAMGVLPEDALHALRRLDGLPGHPDIRTPGIAVNSGSLGMGISKAKGMIGAKRLKREGGRVFVLTGDGELQEGQIWESLGSAARASMGELTVIVDHNKYQSDLSVAATADLGDLEARFQSFGWHVARIDGHDPGALADCFTDFANVTDRPKVIIADTVKGKGVSFMEHTRLQSKDAFYRYHSGAPAAEDYRRAVQELLDRVNKGLAAVGAAPLALETPPPVEAAAAGGDNLQKLVPAYGAALLRAAEANPAIVALDADLVLDTGLIPFKERFPDRFIECGIAEQDMVSQAGGLALSGLLPVVHSFACFLTTRPNEQIYNNATERTKVIYAGSLAGLIPAGPGHSHQSLRDIALLGTVPGLVLVSPACEAEVEALVDYAVNGTRESVYLRLESVPWAVPFALPDGYRPVEGQGSVLHEGGDAAVFAYGPVMASQCVLAARALAGKGFGLRVIDLPWLNRIDADWLGRAVAGVRAVFTVDNHYVAGGQGAMIAAALADAGTAVPAHRLGVTDVPACGRTEEVLEFHGLDAGSLARTIESRTPGA